MFIQDLMVCLQVTADRFTAKTPTRCLVDLPCSCSNPGQKPECESCEYLEACLSRFQVNKGHLSTKKATCSCR